MIDLVSTKLSAPPSRARHVARPDLVAAVTAGVTRRLTLVAAPTGYGKSVLVASWLATRRGRRTAWLGLDVRDNDPVLLTRYLVAALRLAGAPIGSRTELLVRVAGADPSAWMAALVNDLSALPAPVVLAVEDYHVIDNPVCHAVLQYLLDHAPESLHLLMTSRADPPLSLGALRAQGELAELRAPQLRFTVEDATELLVDREGLALGGAAVAALTERTEGWPAGLYLAALWLRDRTDPDADAAHFAGDHRHVVDYLLEVVLDQLEPATRDFLLRTSVLDRLTAPLCAALVGAPGQPLLGAVERSNLFLVPLDQSRTWFRYHHLFRDMLRSELARRRPDLVQTLHGRAADWYRTANMVSEAIEHALAAGDAAGAADLVRGHWLEQGRAGQAGTVRRWLSGFGDEHLRRLPELGIVGGVTVGVSGGTLREFCRWLAVAERTTPFEVAAADRGAGPAVAGVDFLRSTFGYDSVRGALAAGLRSLDTEPLAQGELRPAALANLGQLRYFSGDPAGARRASSEALRDPDAAARPFASITALTTLALVELDRGDAVAGDRLARQAMDYARDLGLDSHQVTGLAHVARGRALSAGGRPAAARVELALGLDMVTGGVLPLREAYALIHAIPVHQREEELAAAGLLADRAEALLARFVDAGALPTLLRRARRNLTRGVRRRRQSGPIQISPAELAVLALLDGPLSRRAMAAELSVSINTVKSHTLALYRMLGVSSRDDAVRRARELDLLEPRSAPAGSQRQVDHPGQRADDDDRQRPGQHEREQQRERADEAVRGPGPVTHVAEHPYTVAQQRDRRSRAGTLSREGSGPLDG